MDKDKIFQEKKQDIDRPEDRVPKDEVKEIGDVLEKNKDVNRPGEDEDLAKSKKDFGKGSEGKF